MENSFYSIIQNSLPNLKAETFPEQIMMRIRQYEAERHYHPLDVSLSFKVGLLYLQLKDYKQAQKCFEDALEKDPSARRLTNIHLYMGVTKLLLGCLHESIEYLNTQKKTKASRYEVFLLSAIACHNLGKTDEAISDINAAVELERNTVNSLTARAMIYEKDNRYIDAAISDYEEVARREPNNGSITNRLFNLRKFKRDTERIVIQKRRDTSPKIDFLRESREK